MRKMAGSSFSAIFNRFPVALASCSHLEWTNTSNIQSRINNAMIHSEDIWQIDFMYRILLFPVIWFIHFSHFPGCITFSLETNKKKRECVGHHLLGSQNGWKFNQCAFAVMCLKLGPILYGYNRFMISESAFRSLCAVSNVSTHNTHTKKTKLDVEHQRLTCGDFYRFHICHRSNKKRFRWNSKPFQWDLVHS